MLNAQEQQMMKSDVESLIKSQGITMTVTRSLQQGAGSFAGSHGSSETSVGEYMIEEKLLSPKSLTEIGADKVVSCKGDIDIREGDRVAINGESFLVSHLKPQNAFGVVTHLEVNLERDRRSG